MSGGIEVWAEGYSSSDGHGQAKLIGVVLDAETFGEAVQSLADAGAFGDADLVTLYDGWWRWWGCRLFDNAEDAARSFG